MNYTQEQGKLPQTYVITTQWKKPRYGMLSERDTVAFGLERKNLSTRKRVWSVTQVYLKKKSQSGPLVGLKT